MKLAIEIQRTSLTYRNLTDLLKILGFTLIDGIEFPALTSEDINSCGTLADAFDIAKRVRSAFTGPAQVDPEFTLGCVIDFSKKPPTRHAFLEASPGKIAFSGHGTLLVLPPQGLSPSELARWNADREEQQYQEKLERQRTRLEPAFRNPCAGKVLELLAAADSSGATLYKVYKLMEGHPKNRDAFHKDFGISQHEFDRFKDVVHNPSVSGDWARHAYHDVPRSGDPMTKDEATAFIHALSARWLVSLCATAR